MWLRRGTIVTAAGGTAAATGPRHGGAPKHREYVVRGAHVVSMDPAIGDLEDGDVHVRNGEIVAVGRNLGVHAPKIDGSGLIAMPGLIDTHWHLWTTLYRAMSSSSPETAYFALNVANGVRCLPSDLYHGARLALVDALNTGITTVHDWAHNLRTPAHADANLRAHQEIGLRGRFSYGTPQGHPGTSLIDLDDIAPGQAGVVRLRRGAAAAPGARRTAARARRRAGLPPGVRRRAGARHSRSATTPTPPGRTARSA